MFDTQPTPYDVSFRFLGFPIRIHPFFWLIAVLLGSQSRIDSLPEWFANAAVWVAAVFASILVHELGHGLVFRRIFGVHSTIVLHGMGGVTIPMGMPYKRPGYYGLFCNVFLSAAGPFAGFALAALVWVFMAPVSKSLLFVESPFDPRMLFFQWMGNVMVISIVWGIFNLLPIYPMDGGQISREIFSFFSPRHGVANSLGLSIFTAVAMLILAVKGGMIFMAILFAYFSYINYRELTFRSPGRW